MLRRIFHNALQTLKKDSGAHFAYNLGVSFVRFGAVLLGAAAIMGFVFIFNPLDFLKYRFDTQAVISNMHTETIEYTGSRGGISYSYRYHVGFNAEVAGAQVYIDQTVPHSVYKSYEKQGRDACIDVKLYKSRNTGLYVSRRGWFPAQLEYGRTHPAATAGIIAFWLAIASLPVIGFGLNQERLGMKYPRTDIDLNGTALVPEDDETGELMKEFDEAFERYQANKAAGLPTSEPPRTDGKKYGEDTLRLEKK